MVDHEKITFLKCAYSAFVALAVRVIMYVRTMYRYVHLRIQYTSTNNVPSTTPIHITKHACTYTQSVREI